MLEWQDDHTVRFTEGGTLYSYDMNTSEITAHFTMAEGNANVHLSTYGNAAYTVGNNVFVSWSEDGSTVQVTKHENPNIVSWPSHCAQRIWNYRRAVLEPKRRCHRVL